MRCARTESIGAYLLGALDGDEACQLQAHLAQCRACTQDLDQLAMLPSLLRWLEPGDIEQLCPDRDPAAREATRSRRLPRTPALAAAVLVAVALVAVLLTSLGSRRDVPHARDLTFTKTDAATHVRATLRAEPRTWGTQLHLWLSGVRAGQRCTLVAHAEDGRAETAASWTATYAGRADVPGATSIRLVDISRVDVVTTGGRQLADIPITASAK